MDPNDHNIVIAATSDGIYKTSDAGANWTSSTDRNFMMWKRDPTHHQITSMPAMQVKF